MMTFIRTSLILVFATTLTGCSYFRSTQKDYAQADAYLHQERYKTPRLKLPLDLTNQQMQDYYPVPDSLNPNDTRVPKKSPPGYDYHNAKS